MKNIATHLEEPKTLRELGVPGPLAAEFEVMLGVMGHVENGQIVGFHFRTPDGVCSALRVESRAADCARAA